MDMARVALLALGHLVVDLYPPFLGTLLPLLIKRFGLSLTFASLLASILMVSAALSQPLFGFLSDRIGGRTLILLGPMLAAVGMSFIGLLPTSVLLIPFLIIGGLGVACFHPQAAVLASHFSGSKKGLGLALFMLGGNVGYGLGPMLILAIVLGLGLGKSFLALLPAIISILLLTRHLPRSILPSPDIRAEVSPAKHSHLHNLRSFSLLWLVVCLRATAIISLVTFLPSLQTMRGFSLTVGGRAITIFLICGALGNIVGGTLSDRIGRKRMVVLSFLLVIPAFYGFLHVSIQWSLLSLALLGFCFFLGESPCLVMAQETFPRSGGTMSAMIMGFAWGIAGLALIGIGALADVLGLKETIDLLIYLPIAALLMAFMLPAARSEEL